MSTSIYDYGTSETDDVADLVDTLTSKQKDLVIGLSQASGATRAILQRAIPKGTRELLETHGALNEDGSLTEFGDQVADHLAYAAGLGPSPLLVARAATFERLRLDPEDLEPIPGASEVATT